DDTGLVINCDDLEITPIQEDDELKIQGTQKGETEPAVFTYSVKYDEGEIPDGSNVRVDTVTNSRPGIVLQKTEWDETTPLAGATFILAFKEQDEYHVIGEFTSDEKGWITTAFLSEDKEYTLTETKTPQGWYGLQEPITITLVNDETSDDVTLSASVKNEENEAYFVVDKTDPNAMKLIIKDRPYTFQAIKKDGDTDKPLSGVKFALHRQVTDGVVTSFDLNPMPGYEELVTNEDGFIPKLDNTLPPGTYELREKAALDGFEALSPNIQFTISQTGVITLGAHPEGTKLSKEEVHDSDETVEYDGTIAYVLTISNYRKRIPVSIWKTNERSETITTGAQFDLYYAEDYENTEQPTPIKSGTTDATGILYLGKLPIGEYRLVETQAPEGYKQLTSAIKIVVRTDGVFAYQQDVPSEVTVEGDENWVAGQEPGTYQIRVWNVPPGVELPMTGGAGTKMFYLTGLALILGAGFLLLIKRRRKEG
ncbi:MAG: LPXTG cell wall anchor domain-containing protein, partial [Erysipelotrichaceae bacterium]|nr:LPXTG cell wall anchor domain-containing protein [Erysipelotrichaceae bacterium]